MSSVAVVGAGLVGSLAALGFAHRGYKVTMYELRNGMHKHTMRLKIPLPH